MPQNKDAAGQDFKQNVFAKFLIAGSAACLADVATFPFDTAKGIKCV